MMMERVRLGKTHDVDGKKIGRMSLQVSCRKIGWPPVLDPPINSVDSGVYRYQAMEPPTMAIYVLCC